MKLRSIQFLRAIAAILVAYAHSVTVQMRFSHSFQQDLFHLPGLGSTGVDIFFVISGFIISYSAGRYKGGGEGVAFLSHRFKRINPVYYTVTVLSILLSLHPQLKDHSFLLTWTQIWKSIILLPVFDRTGFSGIILSQGWTLSFEWFFYLLFLATILSRTHHKERWLMIMISTFVTAGLFLPGSDYRLHFISNPILLEFLLGVVIYWCYSRIRVPETTARILLFSGIALYILEIGTGFGSIGDSTRTVDGSLSLLRFFLWGIPAALLVSGCLFAEKNGSGSFILNNKLIDLLGNSSYSLYLLHFIVYDLCVALYLRVGFFMNPDLAIFVQLALAITASVLFYKWVEAPLLRRLRKSPPVVSPAVPVALPSVTSAVVPSDR
jgi:exopolysaccharide production protein ExoZ